MWFIFNLKSNVINTVHVMWYNEWMVIKQKCINKNEKGTNLDFTMDMSLKSPDRIQKIESCIWVRSHKVWRNLAELWRGSPKPPKPEQDLFLSLILTSCKFYLIRISRVPDMTLTPLLTLTHRHQVKDNFIILQKLSTWMFSQPFGLQTTYRICKNRFRKLISRRFCIYL